MTEFQCLNIVITDWQQIDTPNYDNKLQSNIPTKPDPKYPSPGSNPENIFDLHLHKPSQLLSQVWFSHLVPWFTSGHLAYDTTNLSFCQDPPCLPQLTHIFLHHIQRVPAYSYPGFSTVRIPDFPVHTHSPKHPDLLPYSRLEKGCTSYIYTTWVHAMQLASLYFVGQPQPLSPIQSYILSSDQICSVHSQNRTNKRSPHAQISMQNYNK